MTVDLSVLDVGAPIKVAIKVKNSGKTPAIVRSLKLTCGWPKIPVNYEEHIRTHREKSPWHPRANIIAPDSDYDFFVDDLPIPTQENMSKIKNNVNELFFIATIAYSDADYDSSLEDPEFEGGPETQTYFLYRYDLGVICQHSHFNYMQ